MLTISPRDLKIWDLDSGKGVRTIHQPGSVLLDDIDLFGRTSPARRLAYLRHVGIGEHMYKVVVQQWRSGEPVAQIGCDHPEVGAISPDGRWLFCIQDNALVRVGVDDGSLRALDEDLEIIPSQLDVSPRGTRIATWGNGVLRVWRHPELSLERELRLSGDVIRIAISDDGQRVAAICRLPYNRRSSGVWSLEREGRGRKRGLAEARRLADFRAWTEDVCWAPGGQRLASLAGAGTLVLHDRDGAELARHGVRFTGAAFSPDGERIAVTRRSALHLIDARGDELVRLDPNDGMTTAPQVAFPPCGPRQAPAWVLLSDGLVAERHGFDGRARWQVKLRGEPTIDAGGELVIGEGQRLLAASGMPAPLDRRARRLAARALPLARDFSEGPIVRKAMHITQIGDHALLRRYTGRGWDHYGPLEVADARGRKLLTMPDGAALVCGGLLARADLSGWQLRLSSLRGKQRGGVSLPASTREIEGRRVDQLLLGASDGRYVALHAIATEDLEAKPPLPRLSWLVWVDTARRRCLPPTAWRHGCRSQIGHAGLLVAIGEGPGLRVWDRASGELLAEAASPAGRESNVLSPCGRLLVCPSPDTRALLWQLETAPAAGLHFKQLYALLASRDSRVARGAQRALQLRGDRVIPMLARQLLSETARAACKRAARELGRTVAARWPAARRELARFPDAAAGALLAEIARRQGPAVQRLREALTALETPRLERALAICGQLDTVRARHLARRLAARYPHAAHLDVGRQGVPAP